MNWTYTIDELAAIIGVEYKGQAASFHAVSTDTRKLQPGEVFFALPGENFDGAAFAEEALAKGAAAVVTTRPVSSARCLVVADPLAALQRFAAEHRRRHDIVLVAITGSCGKTSSKDLIAGLLASKYEVIKTLGNLNNEIGCPLSLLRIDESTDCAIIEMGANHAGEIARLCKLARPTDAAITMVAPAHLEGFGSIEKVAEAKGEIISGLAADGTFYLNVDCPWCVRMSGRHPGPIVRYGSQGDVTLKACERLAGGELQLDVEPVGRLVLPLVSRAHVHNVLLAIAVGMRHGVEDFEAPLAAACAAGGRIKIIDAGPLKIIDDTYNANPASVRAALETLMEQPGSGARMAALGDMFELGDAAPDLHRQAGAEAARLGVSHLFSMGAHAGAMIEGAQGVQTVYTFQTETPQTLVDDVIRLAKPGDVLLVKGSRGMRMERVIDALRQHYETSGNE